MFRRLFADDAAPRTVVVVPSLSLDVGELMKLTGVNHYEERMLCLLMLLQLPRTRVVYLTSEPIHPTIIDYYLHLLPGIPGRHARERLTLLNCDDGSMVPLTEKLLARPRLLQRIRDVVADPENAHITCFNASALERTLSVQLGIPLYACDPNLSLLGTKSLGRELFRDVGVPVPDGFEHLRDEAEIIEALAALRRRNPALEKAVVKLNDSFSGEGNALFSFDGAPEMGLDAWVKDRIHRGGLRFEAANEQWETYLAKYEDMGGIVEAFVEGGDEVRSPSVQCRIDPLGRVDIVSTHDQVLAGPTGQVYVGCRFPADMAYRMDIHDYANRIATRMAAEGVLGRLAVDFISVRRGDQWDHYALEMNLRKGGTTLPFLMLQFLTDGEYNPADGRYLTLSGQHLAYYASDNVERPEYRGLTPDDLIDIAVNNGLHFHAASQQGVVFHLIGALSQYGKLGMVCIGDSPRKAYALFQETVACLDRETGVTTS
ncbi:MAG: peptide ligase PGM1-related protein [Acidimicrobiia bacterium]|nr:peptide ligase PGM1-related protein [Acidimicrobiia bacterium]